MRKLCMDCKWYDDKSNRSLGSGYSRCKHETAKDYSLIDNAVIYDYCTSRRLNSGLCGKKGKYWEPKDGDLLNQVKHVKDKEKTMQFNIVVSHRVFTLVTAGLAALVLIMAGWFWPW